MSKKLNNWIKKKTNKKMSQEVQCKKFQGLRNLGDFFFYFKNFSLQKFCLKLFSLKIVLISLLKLSLQLDFHSPVPNVNVL